MVCSILHSSFAAAGSEGLRSIAARLGWREREMGEAYELIAIPVPSFLAMPLQ